MDFLEVMKALIALQETFPNMSWDAEYAAITITLPVPAEITKELLNAQAMFAPEGT